MVVTWPALIMKLVGREDGAADTLSNRSIDVIARSSHDPAVAAVLDARGRLEAAGWTVRVLLADDDLGLGGASARAVRVLSAEARRLYDDAWGFALIGDAWIAHGVDAGEPVLSASTAAARDMNSFAFEAAWLQASPAQGRRATAPVRTGWRWRGLGHAYAA